MSSAQLVVLQNKADARETKVRQILPPVIRFYCILLHLSLHMFSMWRAARTDRIHTAAGVEPLLVASQYDAKTLALHSEQSLAAAKTSCGTRLATLCWPLRGPWGPYAPSVKNRIYLRSELVAR